jgi:hypothetical protein
MTLSVASMAAGVVAGGGAGARSECEVEREGLDQNIELFGLEIIVAADPVKHEKSPSNRTIEVDRPRVSLSGDGGNKQEAGGKLPEAAYQRAVGGGQKCRENLPAGRRAGDTSERCGRVEKAKCR